MTLSEFLLARITEDEAWAEAHPIGRTRGLAECRTKRRIVEDCAFWVDKYPYDPRADLAERTLQVLALPLADHADYDESWRP